MNKVIFSVALSVSTALLVNVGPVRSTPVTEEQQQQQQQGSALIVTPSQSSETNSNVTTTGATLFNASQSVFNVSGNKAEFGEDGCAFPTSLLNIAGNYGSTSSDLSSLSGFNLTGGATIPINGQIAGLCVEAARIRVSLLSTRNEAERRKMQADSLLFCYNLRKLALETRATVIVLPDYCPAELAIVPPPVTVNVTPNTPPVQQQQRELPPPPPNTKKGG